MTQTNQQGVAMAIPTASAIVVMHQRYEAASAAHHALDLARDLDRYMGAMSDLVAEQDALRVAILQQVPESRDEFAIVLFHTNNAYDLMADNRGEDWNADEGEAVRVAMQHLFDFAASEFAADPLTIGRAFSREAMRTRKLRLLRTGNPEA